MAAVLFKYSDDEYFAEMASRSVRNLATNDHVIPVLASEGISDALVKVLRENKSPQVHEQCLWAIVNLSCDEQVASILGAAGALDAIGIISRSCSHEVIMIEAISAAIRNLTSQSQANISIITHSLNDNPLTTFLITAVDLIHGDVNALTTVFWASANLSSSIVLADDFIAHGIIPRIESVLQQAIGQIFSRGDDDDSDTWELLESVVWFTRNLLDAAREKNQLEISFGSIQHALLHILQIGSKLDNGSQKLSIIAITLDALRSLVLVNEKEIDNEYLEEVMRSVMEIAYALYAGNDDDANYRLVFNIIKLTEAVALSYTSIVPDSMTTILPRLVHRYRKDKLGDESRLTDTANDVTVERSVNSDGLIESLHAILIKKNLSSVQIEALIETGGKRIGEGNVDISSISSVDYFESIAKS